MTTYSITYDLYRPDQDYESLYAAIKSIGSWCHPLRAKWFIKSNLSAEQIRNHLQTVLGNSDVILVETASSPAAWFGLQPEVANWIKNNL